MDSESPLANGTTGRASDVAESLRFIFRSGTFKTEFRGDRAGNDRLASGPSLWSSAHRRRAEGHGL
jgi:hypothetical protein